MANHTSNWTFAQNELLIRLWKEGYSAAQIGSQIGRSRNAVIGKIHRELGEESRRKPRQRSVRPSAELQRLPPPRVFKRLARNLSALVVIEGAAQPAPDERANDMSTTRIKFMPIDERALRINIFDLKSHHCRWPIDDPAAIGGFVFCGQDKAEGCAYCTAHARMAFSQNSRAA